ncbi:hypothetical protein [Ornithinimicrobium sp. LYQ103]|uniref:hypothetical protein n=1 Tax=Ornithinimicrobium sp. LYQ103 TaxID=3378796 RepID=UPI0038549533
MRDRLLLGAAVLFAANTVFASVLATRDPEVPGEPLGLHVPGSVTTHLALGWGAGVAAPWPMPVVATWAAWRAAQGARGPARTVATIGAMLLVGTLIEPVTWGRRPATRLVRATVPVNLACGAAMVLAGTHRLRSAVTR